MLNSVMTLGDIKNIVGPIARQYKIKNVYVFGSYARDEADASSDIDFLIYGDQGFKPTHVFSFAEELRELLHKDVDVFEICEINKESAFYETIMKERVLVA